MDDLNLDILRRALTTSYCPDDNDEVRKRAAERLVQEGYLRRKHLAEKPGMPPKSICYEITPEGKQTVTVA